MELDRSVERGRLRDRFVELGTVDQRARSLPSLERDVRDASGVCTCSGTSDSQRDIVAGRLGL